MASKFGFGGVEKCILLSYVACMTILSYGMIVPSYDINLAYDSLPVDSLCLAPNSDDSQSPTLVIGSSTSDASANNADLTCKTASLFKYTDAVNGQPANLSPASDLPTMWRNSHWKVSESKKSKWFWSDNRISVNVKNKSPTNLKIVGTTDGDIQKDKVKGMSDKTYKVEPSQLVIHTEKLRWISDFAAKNVFGPPTVEGSGDATPGDVKAAIMYNNFDPPSSLSSTFVASRARFVLTEAVNSTAIKFYSHEASLLLSPTTGSKSRKLLLLASLIEPIQEMAALVGCPGGYCFRLLPPPVNCVPGNPAYSSCLIRCVCN